MIEWNVFTHYSFVKKSEAMWHLYKYWRPININNSCKPPWQKTKPDNQINKPLKLKVVSLLVERRELTAMRGWREGGCRKGWVASSASSSGGRLPGRAWVQGDPTLPNPRTKGCWSHCAPNKGGWLVYGLGKGLSDGRRPATQVNSFVKPERAFRLENNGSIILQHE